MSDPSPPLSLLSLSLAAAQSPPLPETDVLPPTETAGSATSPPTTRMKTRRLSSASAVKRRQMDAKEAGIRTIQGPAMNLLSNAAAALSLSSSPTVTNGGAMPLSLSIKRDSSDEPTPPAVASSLPHVSSIPALPPPGRVTTHASGHQSFNGTLSVGMLEELPPATATITGSKKKGTIFRCESCSKVYRHPSCLVKHRWEHSPHWKEANKFLLSKHQQVQLLEAAAILSHITPTPALGAGPATSLPDDRSLWPSYLASYEPPLAKVRDDDLHPEEEEEGDDEEDADAEARKEAEDDGELEMEFDMPLPSATSFGSGVGVMGPLSSSVPASSMFSAMSPPMPGVGHHRNRSRSRSISKSIHTHTLMSMRSKRRDDVGVGVGVVVGSAKAAAAAPALTTFRPGLIGIPTGSSVPEHPHPEGDIWSAHRLPPEHGRNVNGWRVPDSHSVPAQSFNSSSYTLSLPRSSLRSSSSFTETETETDGPEELFDEYERDGSGSRGSGGSGGVGGSRSGSEEKEHARDWGVKGKTNGKEEAWDGMEMDMEMGY